MSTIATHQLTLRAGERTLVENLDWQVGPGECWSIIGRNGAGKSTLCAPCPAASAKIGRAHV